MMFCSQLLRGELAHLLALEVLRLDGVHRDLRPDQQADAIGEVLDVGVQRIVRADDGRAELLGLRDDLRATRGGDREAGHRVVLVQPDAAQRDLLAVEQHAPVHDLDRADAAVDPVGDELAPLQRDAEAHRVERRARGRPELRLGDAHVRHEAREAARRHALRREARAPAAVGPGDVDAQGAIGVVAHGDAHPDVRRARRARQVGAHDDTRHIDPVDALQIDLAQDPAVVPPASRGIAGPGQPRRREVGRQAAVVDADDEAVRARALEALPPQAQLERQVRAGIAADELAVEPHARAVVHRLEAHKPVHPAPRVGQLEVLAVPADRALKGGDGVVAGVPGTRDLRHRPAVGRRLALEVLLEPDAGPIQPEHPVAAQQIAAVGRVAVRRAAGDAVGGPCPVFPAEQRERDQQGDRGCEVMTHLSTGHNTPTATELCRGYGQLDSRPIGALRRRRLIEIPANTFPLRRTSTHCTVVRRPRRNHTMRVGFVRDLSAWAVCDW